MARNPSAEFVTSPRSLLKNSVSILNVQPATFSEWDAIWLACNYSTYFHSREWAEIWSCYSKGKISLTPFLVVFSDGKKALLPFSCLTEDDAFQILSGTRRLYLLSPECTYGGWLSTDKLGDDHAFLLLDLLKWKFKNVFWRMNPLDDVALSSICHLPSGIVDDTGETHTINLEKGFDLIASNMSRDHRRAVKKALQNGVSVKISSSIEDWRDYYQVYEDTLSRWGNRLLGEKYSWQFFEDIFNRNSSNVELWLATYQNKVISGALFFHSKRHFVDWHSAALESYLNLKPVNLLLYEVIKYACEKGYTWFDFNPSAGLEGVKSFKEGFGAETLKCPIVNMQYSNTRTFILQKAYNWIGKIKKRTNL